MSSAFSAATKIIIHPLPLNSTARSPEKPLFDLVLKLSSSSFSSSYSFLGSANKFRLSRPNFAPALHRSFAVIAVKSYVLKEKKLKSNTSLTNQLIKKDENLEVYEDMILGRAFEDMCAQMYYRGKMFRFVYLYNGQEAVPSGFIKLLKKEDSVVSTYRDHVHALSKGVPAFQVMSEFFGKTTGCCRGQGGSMHMFSKEHNILGGFAFIGEGIPVATGAAFSSKYHREVLKEANCDHDIFWGWDL